MADFNAQSWTTSELVADVRRKASLPVTSTDFPDAVLLREATDVLWTFAGWAMQQAGEGRLSTLLERPITAALSSAYRAASEFELPPLAILDTLESVAWLDASGQNESRLGRLDASVQSDYDRPGSEGVPSAYALVGDRIRLYPRPTEGGTLRIVYQRRHPMLILDDPTTNGNVISVASASDVSTLVTLGYGPVFPPGARVDITGHHAPYRTLLTGVSVVASTPTTLTVHAPLSLFPSGYTDYFGARVTYAGQSTVVHFPLEFRPAVNEKVAANVLRILGDAQGSQACEQAATGELARLLGMMSPRTKRDRPKAVNPYSHLRGGMRAGWRPR